MDCEPIRNEYQFRLALYHRGCGRQARHRWPTITLRRVSLAGCRAHPRSGVKGLRVGPRHYEAVRFFGVPTGVHITPGAIGSKEI